MPATAGSVGLDGVLDELSAGEEDTFRLSPGKTVAGPATVFLSVEPEPEATAMEASALWGASCSVCPGVVTFIDCGDCSGLWLCCWAAAILNRLL